MKQYDKVVEYYVQALAVYREIAQGADTEDIANTLYNLGVSYWYAKKYSKAEESYQEVIAIYTDISATHEQVAKSLHNLGNMYTVMNQYDDAERSYLKALDIWRQLSSGTDSVDIAKTLRSLGWCYRDAGMDRKAKETLTQALDITIKLDPENTDRVRIKSYLSTHSDDEPPQTLHHAARESLPQSNLPINTTLSKRKRCCIC